MLSCAHCERLTESCFLCDLGAPFIKNKPKCPRPACSHCGPVIFKGTSERTRAS